MKHLKTLFVFMLTLMLGIGQMWADVGDVYYTFLPYKPSKGAVTDYTKTGTMTIDGKDWTVPGNWYGNGALRLGGKSLNNVDRTIIGQDTLGVAIAKIRVAHAGKTSDAITLNSVTVTTASDADFTKDVTTKTVTSFTVAKNTKDTIDIVPTTEPWATGSYYKIAFNLSNSNSSNYAFVVERILFYAYKESGPSVPTVSAVQGETDVVADGLSFTAKQNVAVTPQTFTLTGANLTEGLTLTSSSEAFVVSPTSLTKAAAEAGATITVTPATPTEATSPVQGTLTISGEEGLDDTEIALSMTVTPTYAVGVALNVKDKDDNVLTGENIPAGIAATIAGGASYYATNGESNIALAATTIAGWDFEGWTATAGTIADADALSTTLTAAAEAATVTASFQEKKCTILGTPTNVVVSGIAVANYPYESVALAWDAVDNAAGYSVTIKQGENVVESDDVTTNAYSVSTALTPNTEYTYEIIATNSDAAYCASNVATANFTTGDYPAATLTLSVNGATSGDPLEGKLTGKVTLPSSLTSAIQGKIFVGWSTEAVTSTDTKPSGATFFEPGAEFTLSATSQTVYAVLASEIPGDPANDTYKLVSDLTVGKKYIFASSNAAGNAYALPAKDMQTDAANSAAGVEIIISSVDSKPVIATVNADLEYLYEALQAKAGSDARDTLKMQVAEDATYYLCVNGSGLNKRAWSKDTKVFWENGLYGTNGKATAVYYVEYKSSDHTFIKGGSSTSSPTYAYERTSSVTNADYTTQAYAVSFAAPMNGTLAIKKGDAAITSGDYFSAGVELTIEATPAEGYQLIAIKVNDNELSGTTLTVPAEAVTVTAEFEAIPVISGVPTEDIEFPDVRQHGTIVDQTFTLTGANLTSKLTLSATGGFTVSPEEITPEAGAVNQLITLSHSTEVADDFVGTLTISGGGLAAAATVDLLLTVTPTYLVQIAVNDANMGSATLNGGTEAIYADAADELALIATPESGYEFVNWTINEDNILIASATSASTTASTITGAVTITANFQAPVYSITSVSANNDNYGTVSLDGMVITATPAEGYRFADPAYTITGGTANVVQDGNTFTVSGLTADCAITINFEPIPTYTAKWFVNGSELTESAQTAEAGTTLTVPADPSASGDCEGLVFRGWAAAPIDGSKAEAPTFVTDFTMPSDDVNFYAVFAEENITEQEGDPEWVATAYADLATDDVVVVTITKPGTNAGTYALPNDNGTTSAPTATTITITDNQIDAPADNLQWDVVKDGDNITFNVHGSTTSWLYCKDTNNGVRVGNTTDDNDATNKVFMLSDGGLSKNYYLKSTTLTRYIGVYNAQDWRCYGSINNNLNSGDQELTFFKKTVSKTQTTTYSGYLTTCPSCGTVTLSAASVEHGSIALSKESVKTCEAAEVTVTATPDPGYKLDDIELNGVAATYSEGVISIPQDAEGTLTVTATFSAIDYTVTMVTGCDAATISDNQTQKHVGEVIEVTANEPEGFAFLGWSASPAVEFVNAKALSTTFTMPASDVTITATYAPLYTVAQAIDAINNDGTTSNVVVEGYITDFYSTSVSSGKISYYIQDLDENGFATGEKFEAYNGKGLNNTNFTQLSDLEVGAKVRIYGNIKYYSNGKVYELDNGNYLISYTDPEFSIAWTRPNDDEAVEVVVDLEKVNDNQYVKIDFFKNVFLTGTYTVKVTSTDVVQSLVFDEVGLYEFQIEFNTTNKVLSIETARKGDTMTGVDETVDGQKAVKMMKDNTIYIIRGDKTYTITGQVVK